MSAMDRMLCLTIAALAVVLVTLPTSASAQVLATQIQLAEKHVEGFIAGPEGDVGLGGKDARRGYSRFEPS